MNMSFGDNAPKIVGGLVLAGAVAAIIHRVATRLNPPKYEDLLKRDGHGCTPLHTACASDTSGSIEHLLTTEGLAAINLSCDRGWTPLLLATSKGHLDIVKTLLQHGAHISHSNADGYTPLMIASFNGSVELVRFFVSRSEDSEKGWGLYDKSNKAETAFFFACVKGEMEIVKILLEKDKEYYANRPPPSVTLLETMAFNGGTPLHAATESKNSQLVEFLLAQGANPNALDLNNATPLHLAAASDSIEVLEILAKVSNLNAPNSFGSSPLHDAVFQGKLELAKILLKNGASVDLHDNDGLLPIHAACRSASPHAIDVLELLITYGSDVDGRDSTGRTPLQMCAVKKERGKELAEVLLNHKADLTLENAQGWNALHVALSEYGYEPTATLFRDFAQKHLPDFLSTFSAEKPRKISQNSRPPRFCSLTPEQQKNVLGGMTPSLEAIGKYILDGKAKKILVLTGAGISVSAGIPDFRTPGKGIYTSSLSTQYGLPEGPSMFDIGNFHANPQAFYHMAYDVFFPALEGNVRPTAAHRFIKLLHDKNLLLRNYTQNIDSLEKVCGLPSESLVEVHGTLGEYCCSRCNDEFTLDFVKSRLVRNLPPLCSCSGLIRPKTVFFGDDLPKRYYEMYIRDTRQCDLLIVMGTSLKVYPFASLVNMVDDDVPRMLINLKSVGPFEEIFEESEWNYRDVSVVQECDTGVQKLCDLLGWQL